jgi:hypothetical protein
VRRAPSPLRSALLLGFLVLLGNQPCGPIPGDALEGELVAEPVADWSFVDAVPRCQLEVRPEQPHSVTTYCFAGDDGVLYVPAIMGDSKKWTKLAVADPRARIRIAGKIHPVTIERIDDPTERLVAARLGYRKYHDGEEPPADFDVPEDRWFFRLRSR